MQNLIYPFSAMGYILRKLKVTYHVRMRGNVYSQPLRLDRGKGSKLKMKDYASEDPIFMSYKDVTDFLEVIHIQGKNQTSDLGDRMRTEDKYIQHFYLNGSGLDTNEEYLKLLNQIVNIEYHNPRGHFVSPFPGLNRGFVTDTFYQYFIGPKFPPSEYVTKKHKPLPYATIYHSGDRYHTVIEFELEARPIDQLHEMCNKKDVRFDKIGYMSQLFEISLETFNKIKDIAYNYEPVEVKK